MFSIAFLLLTIILSHNVQSLYESESVIVDECKGCKDTALQKKPDSGENFGIGGIELFCKDERKIALVWTSNGTEVDFLVEFRPQFNNTWIHAKTVHEPRAILKNLSGGYVFRITPFKRFINKTGLTRESETLFTLSRTIPLSRISYANITLSVTFEKHLSAILSWQPVKELVCGYSIIIWRVGYENYEISPSVDDLYEVVIQNLYYSTEYQIGVHAITEKVEGPKYWIHYVTPSCAEQHEYDYTYCAPEKPRNFSMYTNKCVIFLSWEVPPKLPDAYFLQIQSFIEDEAEDFKISGDRNNFSVDTSSFGENFDIQFYAIANSRKGDEINSRIKNQCEPDKRKTQKEMSKNQDYSNSYMDDFTFIIRVGLMILAVIFVITLFAILFLTFCQTTISCGTAPESQPLSKKNENVEVKNTEEANSIAPLSDEINSKMLEIQEILGKGEFGIVSKALLRISEKEIEVAVKSIRGNASKEDKDCFHSEVEMMKTVGKHKNLVSFVGYCSSDKLLVVEYCALGDLQNFLRETRKTRILLQELANTDSESYEGLINDTLPAHVVSNALYERTDAEKKHLELTTIDLLSLARQIANGMEYLSTNKIIHRDLAARNILLTSDLTAKISDFGLSRDIYLESVYRKKHISKLPIKWMAPESLSQQLFTTQSDVWSFGILLWEIMTLGGAPYPSIPSGMIYKLLKSGYRMEKPPSCIQEVYDIMTSCWNGMPRKRPSFSNIMFMLDKVLNNKSKHEYIELDPNSVNYAHVSGTEE